MANPSTFSDLAKRAVSFAKTNAPGALDAATKALAAKGTNINQLANVATSQAQGTVVEALMANGMDAKAFRSQSTLSDAEMMMFATLFTKYEQAAEAALNKSATPVASTGSPVVDFVARCKDIEFALGATALNADSFLRLAEVFRTIDSKAMDEYQASKRMGVKFTA